jgi:hypothetical protein
MSWHGAACLMKATAQISDGPGAPWPTPGIGDGMVGDTSHQARKSDHNPDYSMGGVVRAIDVGIAGRPARDIINGFLKDYRTWYVIHDGIIYSRTYGFAPRRYTGSNPHGHHIHESIQGANGVSVAFAYQVERDTRDWQFTGALSPTPPQPPRIYFPVLMYQFKVALGVKNGKIKSRRAVRVVQAKIGVKPDGIVGPKTLTAWRQVERKYGKVGRLGLPDAKTLRKLGIRMEFKDTVKR